MEKNLGNFSMEDTKKLVDSPAGKQLFSLLQQSGNINMEKVMEQASNGNYTTVKEMLAPMLKKPEIQMLIRQLGGK